MTLITVPMLWVATITNALSITPMGFIEACYQVYLNGVRAAALTPPSAIALPPRSAIARRHRPAPPPCEAA